MSAILIVCLLVAQSGLALGQTDAQLRTISQQIWAADSNRITGSDVQYSTTGTKLFTYVNEARFNSGTWARMRALFDNYEPLVNVPETCGQSCVDEENAFLDAIMATQPMILLQNFLVGQGLASSSAATFKNELRQYWFMKYSRASGILGSTGFEHTFVGEIGTNNAVSGFHNWVYAYYEEKAGNFVYGPYQRTCQPEILAFGFRWLGRTKSISSVFIRSSPEVEIALYTLCLLARTGSSCPIQLGSVQLQMTTWDMTGYPKTIGSAYPNC